MTQYILIKTLLENGIIHRIGENEYFFTSKYEELIKPFEDGANVIELQEVDISDLVLYPESIRNVSVEKQIEALLDYCEVPVKSAKGYLLHSYDKDTKAKMKAIMHDKDIVPDTLIRAIKDYYQHSEYPKAFKRFVSEGDIMAMYKMTVLGKSLNSEQPESGSWI